MPRGWTCHDDSVWPRAAKATALQTLRECLASSNRAKHMAICLRDGAKKLEHSSDNELVVRYEPLTGINQSYDVEFVPDSGILVTGKNGGTSTDHLNYVHVGQRFDLKKTNDA